MTTPTVTQFRVKPRLTPKRRTRTRQYVENPDYTAFVSRVLRAHGRRIAEGDIDGLTELVQLTEELDTAITTAITGLRGAGFSWTDIATRLGITKQAAHHKWGNTTRTTKGA